MLCTASRGALAIPTAREVLTCQEGEEEVLQAPLHQVHKHVLPGQEGALGRIAAHGGHDPPHPLTQDIRSLLCSLQAHA